MRILITWLMNIHRNNGKTYHVITMLIIYTMFLEHPIEHRGSNPGLTASVGVSSIDNYMSFVFEAALGYLGRERPTPRL